MNRPASPPTLLEVRGLTVELPSAGRMLKVVDGLDLRLEAGQTLGLVGESGCGKSITALALMGMAPGARVTGSVRLEGEELVGMEEARLKALRGRAMAMVFQDPMTALNPVSTIATQMIRILRRHRGLTRRQARTAAVEFLGRTGIPDPGRRIDDHPHRLSGGMRQRVMLAMALSCGPRVLLADEPTTALDVTTQAQVLELIADIQGEYGMGVVLITHDLGVVAETCHRAAVMYCGMAVEEAPTPALFSSPGHPYTAALLESRPGGLHAPGSRLPVIPGTVPGPGEVLVGCPFALRCPKAAPVCASTRPPSIPRDVGRLACHFPVESRREFRRALITGGSQ